MSREREIYSQAPTTMQSVEIQYNTRVIPDDYFWRFSNTPILTSFNFMLKTQYKIEKQNNF